MWLLCKAKGDVSKWKERNCYVRKKKKATGKWKLEIGKEEVK